MGKTTKDPAKRAKWKFLSTARNFKESHTEGNRFKSRDGTMYTVMRDGSWRKDK